MQLHKHSHASRGGFSLLELVIATALLSLVLGAVGLVQMRTRDASRVGLAQEQAESLCRRTLNRVADELGGVGHSLLFPDPSTNLGVSTLTYQHPTGVSNLGVVSWDTQTSLSLQMAQGETNAGIENTLHLSASTVEKHVNSIFGKLRLADAPVHRRVAAVLTFLRDSPPG